MSANLLINTDLAKTILTGFIHSEITRSGFSRAVIGLSGGIDSALSCVLAAEALGPENVLAVRMPYKSSSLDSLEDAQRVIEKMGVQSLTVPITEMVEPLFERFPDANAMRRGNIMARARMIVLYDQSEAFGGLVVGTGNKTEILLGYSNLYGDSACASTRLAICTKRRYASSRLRWASLIPSSTNPPPPTCGLVKLMRTNSVSPTKKWTSCFT